MTAPVRARWFTVALAVALVGCGRLGDPIPSHLRRPVAPTGLRASGAGEKLTLQWTAPRRDVGNRAVGPLSGYEILRSAWPPGESPCDACPDVEAVAGRVDLLARRSRAESETIWVDRGAEPGWIYRYRVRALDDAHRPGLASTTLQMTWAPPAALSVTAEDGDGEARLHVTTQATVVAHVYDDKGRFLAQGDPITGPLRVAPLANGRKHRLFVRAGATTPEGWAIEGPATEVSVHPADTTPTLPPADLAVLTSPTGVRILWAAAGPEPYAAVVIFRAEGEEPLTERVRVDGNAAEFIDTDTVVGRVYRYAVATEDAAGNQSPRSRVVEVRRR